MDVPADPPPLTEEQIQRIIEVFPVGTVTTVKGGLQSEDEARLVDFLVRHIALQMREEYPHLSYDNLRQIIFAQDYRAELVEQGKLYGRNLAPTEHQVGLSMAMTNLYPHGCMITVDSGLARNMLSEDPKSRFLGLQMLAHELCHVSDETFKAKLFGEKWRTPKQRLEYIYLPAVSTLWSEYYAHRYSGIFMMEPAIFTGMLSEVIKSTHAELKIAVGAYISDKNHSKISETFRLRLRFLCQCIGYAAGAIRGTRMTLEECDPACAAVIAGSQLAEQWPLVLKDLDAMTESYGSWKDISALDPLMTRVQAIEVAYGFKHSVPAEGQVWVDVDFTDYLD